MKESQAMKDKRLIKEFLRKKVREDDELIGTCGSCCLTFTFKDWFRNKERCPNCNQHWEVGHNKSLLSLLKKHLKNGPEEYYRHDIPENILGGSYGG